MPELKRIMLAEDEPDLQEITKEALTSLGGFEVFCCSSGVEVLANFEQHKPDLLLLDVVMPNLDGVETFKKLIGDFQINIPVVFLTAKTRKSEISQLKSIGASHVLTKPVNFMTLATDLNRIYTDFHAK